MANPFSDIQWVGLNETNLHRLLLTLALLGAVALANIVIRATVNAIPADKFSGAKFWTRQVIGIVVTSALVLGLASIWITKPENLTADNKAWDAQPTYSPDGSRLAYRAMKRPGFEADRFGIMVRAVQKCKDRGTGQPDDARCPATVSRRAGAVACRAGTGPAPCPETRSACPPRVAARPPNLPEGPAWLSSRSATSSAT